MKRTIIAAALLLTAAAAHAEIRGAWTAMADDKSDRLHFNFARRNSNNGQSMAISSFTGLTAAQVDATTQTPVRFELRREAGTAVFEGVFRAREGAGHFTFTGNSGYYDAVRALGVSVEPKKDRGSDNAEERMFHYAVHDVSTSFIRSMQAEGYRVSLDEYLTMRIFRINPQLVAELRDLGYRNIAFDDLVATAVHKVTPAYIREMRAAGFRDLSLDELVATRIHKVTPEFASQMKALGYDLPIDELQAFRIHKVTPEFVRELAALGYRNIDADDLVAMRIHKVTPEYIRKLRDAGYANVPISKMIEMRIHRIEPEFIQKMNGHR